MSGRDLATLEPDLKKQYPRFSSILRIYFKGPYVGQTAHNVPDIGMDGSCANAHQHLIIFEEWLVDLPKFQGIG